MSTNKVNVGVIGFGMSARVFHCPLVTSSPFLHLYGVVERRSDKSKEVYPWVQVFKSTEDLFANKEVDLVVITTPNESHYTLALEAMKAGKHVVVEKPFTVTSKEAEDLAQVAKETNRICSVYQNRRWDGDFLTVKKLIKANHLGRLVEYESHFDRFRNFVKAGWREQDDQPGAGMVYDLGAHLIDQALHLFGMPKTVFATISNQRQLKESNVADDFTIILGYDNAFKVLLRSSMLSRHTPVLRFNLRGMNGSFRKEYLDVQEDQLKSGKVPSDGEYGVESRERYGTIDSDIGGVHLIGTVETEKGDYLSFYNNVAESILKSDPEHLAVKPQDGVNCIRIIELAQQSNDEGRVITI
ncbi:scyllo-inositol 2-dehydrogenase (NADP(+)) [Choanephora cucurbitarum]|uniref:Scyllo-inositol 2-dehydrogenase (NADP(+)) n=1 Tax=Choanephora cucurbitarum TaxID=101091 RepID=A0A1C7NGG8_9FUNG|nr:scyllo-inositol 2-dehydrogenase (NADP(+)) [Choanephora cucurbitarum]